MMRHSHFPKVQYEKHCAEHKHISTKVHFGLTCIPLLTSPSLSIRETEPRKTRARSNHSKEWQHR